MEPETRAPDESLDHAVDRDTGQSGSEGDSGSTELVVPYIGEVVDLREPDDCARALATVQTVKRDLGMVERGLKDALAGHAALYGSGTMPTGVGLIVKVTGGVERSYDVVRLRRELRAAGMSKERCDEIIEPVVDYKVHAVKLNQAAKANPEFARIIGDCTFEVPKPKSVSLS